MGKRTKKGHQKKKHKKDEAQEAAIDFIWEKKNWNYFVLACKLQTKISI